MTYRVRDSLHGCNHLNTEPCTHCDGMRTRRATEPIKSPHVLAAFPEDTVFEHAFSPWETPRPVSNREDLRQLCNTQGVTSEYLRDSTIWRSGERRWI